ncbi:WD40 repeat domain-containing serine/threonine-protein kinase [Pirellulales bacterium]|nr:WD40 repeat domain-containing serine/threonine-protein kinase [Pirellulales bacterium]
MNSDADHNLLYGLLAYQLGWIDRATLVAAMKKWAHAKSRPLGEMLLDEGALSATVKELLDALLAEHVRRNDGSMAQSLQALSSIGSVREDLASLADADLNATLGHVPADTTQPHVAASLKSSSHGMASTARYRIIKPHAKGGLGQVSIAVDDELSREVALKELQSRFADDQKTRARFSMEAEVTGRLEHPGIVPVYGAGTYADGRPFYAMRFVRGDSLQEAVAAFHEQLQRGKLGAEYDLELRKLLRRFVDVCDAIEYAHSRGVLHRDLKPGNIMLGRYGETLVVDWGLAKPLETHEPDLGETEPAEPALLPLSASGSAPTQMGAAVGTPHYMSPEQAAGRIDDLGPASDIYSLGSTLYCLLTGRAPYEGTDVDEILAAVEHGRVQPPRKWNSKIAKPLEAICLKAMARDPGDRYESPRVMAEDVERWLADQSVGAYSEPWHVRTGRWLRRHRVAAGAGLSALGVALAAAVVIASVLAESNTKLADKESAAVAARDEAISARNEAAELAEKNQRMAEAAQRQVSQTHRRQAVRRLESDDVASGLLNLIASLDSLPDGDARRRDAAARNLAAWCNGAPRLNRIKDLSGVSIEELPDTDRLLSSRYVPGDPAREPISPDGWTEGPAIYQLLDAETFLPVGPEYGPFESYAEVFADDENDVLVFAIIESEETVDPDTIEAFPERLDLSDENRDRLQVADATIRVQRCKLSTGLPAGKPFLIRQRGFEFGPGEDDSVDLDEYGLFVAPVRDDVINVLKMTDFLAIQRCVGLETEIWSLETGERLDVVLPAGESRLSNGQLLAVKTSDKTIKFFNPSTGKETTPPVVHQQPVANFEFNIQGDRMATVTSDGKLHAWQTNRFLTKLEVISDQALDDPAFSIEMARNYILTITRKGVVQLWQVNWRSRRIDLLRTYSEISGDQLDGAPVASFLDDDGTRVLIEFHDHLQIWNSILEPKEEARPFATQPVVLSLEQTDFSSALLWDFDGKYFATCCNGKLSIRNLDGVGVREINHPGKVVDLRLWTEAERLVTVGDDGVIRIWGFTGRLQMQSANALSDRGRALFKPRGDASHSLASLEFTDEYGLEGVEQTLEVWELPAVEPASNERFIVFGAPAVGPDEQSIIVSEKTADLSGDGSTLIEFIPPDEIGRRETETELVPGHFLVFHEFGKTATAKKIGSFSCPSRVNSSRVEASRDGNRAVAMVTFQDESREFQSFLNVQLWDLVEGKPGGPIVEIRNPTPVFQPGDDGSVWRADLIVAAVDPTLTKMVACETREEYTSAGIPLRDEFEFHIWDLASGEPIGVPLFHDQDVQCAAFSSDGNTVATGSKDRTARLWNATTGKPLGDPLLHASALRELFFQEQESKLLTLTADGMLRTWETTTGEPTTPPMPLPYQNWTTAALSEDGQSLYVGSVGGDVVEVDAATAAPIGPPRNVGATIGQIVVRSEYLIVKSGREWRLLPRIRVNPDDHERVKLWARVISGVQAQENGIMARLTAEEVEQANRRLDNLGGPLTFKHPSPEIINMPDVREQRRLIPPGDYVR